MNGSHDLEYACDNDCGGIKAYIQIYYGPYVSCGILRHRTQRLRNLVDAMEDMGHTVELIPIKLWDRVEINICGRAIYRLKLTQLEINPANTNDDLNCQQAICAIVKTLSRMNNASMKNSVIYERI